MESAALSRDLSHRFFMAARGIGVLDFTARGFTPVSFSLIFFSGKPPCFFQWGRAGLDCYSASSQSLIRLGGHQLVELGVLGKGVLKRYNVPSATDEPTSCRHVGDVT